MSIIYDPILGKFRSKDTSSTQEQGKIGEKNVQLDNLTDHQIVRYDSNNNVFINDYLPQERGNIGEKMVQLDNLTDHQIVRYDSNNNVFINDYLPQEQGRIGEKMVQLDNLTDHQIVRYDSNNNIFVNDYLPQNNHFINIYYEKTSEPSDPNSGETVSYMSDGNDGFNEGDIIFKINVGGTIKKIKLIDFNNS